MATHIKRREILGIALEGTAGTPVVPQHYIEFLDCDIAEEMKPISDESARGSSFAEGPNPVEGKKIGSGKLSVVLDPLTAPYFFALALGNIDSEASGDDYKHTSYLDGGNDPLSATLWRDRIVDQRQFANAVIDKWDLSFADDVIKLAMDFKTKYPTSQARTAAAIQSLKLYTFKNANVKIDGTTFKTTDFSLAGENNVKPIYAPGSNDVDRFVSGEKKISGSFKILFESTGQRAKFEGLTKQAMVLTFTGSDGDSITITIPQFRVENWKQDGGMGDAAEEVIEFTVEESEESGDETVITTETVNNVEEYLSIES